MRQRHYAPGDIIFREGEPSDSVFRIIGGRVEVLKEQGPRRVVLGHIGDGEYCGEMGVIERRPRGATVRAESSVPAEWIEPEDFLRKVSENSQTAFDLIVRLSERLSTLSAVYSEAIFSREPVFQTDQSATPATSARTLSNVTVYADGPKLTDKIAADGLAIDAFPFVVGRSSRRQQSASDLGIHLLLDDHKPYSLSRVHFAIVRTADGFQVRDMQSTLGTSVNGTFLGKHFGSDRAALKYGDNCIIAGGLDSPFRFRIVC